MRTWQVRLLLGAWVVLAGCDDTQAAPGVPGGDTLSGPVATSKPTLKPSAPATASRAPVPTAVPTHQATPVATATPVPSPTQPAATAAPTATPATATPTPTPTPTSPTPTPTPTPATVSFSVDVAPIIGAHCAQCHSPAGPGSVVLTDSSGKAVYSDVQTHASLVLSQVQSGAMPQGGPALSAADVATIRQWVQEGTPQN